MKKIAFFAVCFVFTTIGVSGAAQSDKSEIKLLVPNVTLIPSQDVKSGETMFGLYNTDLGYVLLPSKIVVESGVDDRCRKNMKVRVEGEKQPVLLVSGLSSLKSGKVKTVFSGRRFLFPGESFVLKNDEQEGGCPPPLSDRYVLTALGRAVNHADRDLIYDYAVKMSRRGQSQTLEYYKAAENAQPDRPTQYGILDVTNLPGRCHPEDVKRVPVLTWAGDLDRDGKPDLFMWWPCPGKDAGVQELFLSSKAKGTNFVEKIPSVVLTPPLCK